MINYLLFILLSSKGGIIFDVKSTDTNKIKQKISMFVTYILNSRPSATMTGTKQSMFNTKS